jgi:ubiquinone/menaquinone biosynthesis C-methylase UbiE
MGRNPVKEGVSMFFGKYSALDYWNKRPNPNNEAGESATRVQRDIEYIREGVKGATTILEIGPGVGRTLNAYSSGQKITGYDVSRIYTERLMEKAKGLGLSLEMVYASADAEAFPFSDGQFDVGVSCQVFLHQKPAHLELLMSEMARVCKKVVVVSGNYKRLGWFKHPHVFVHDYLEMSTKLSCVANNVMARDRILYFTYARSRV